VQFRDLKKQYQVLKEQTDAAVLQVMSDANFISGKQVSELEAQLAEYVGVKHCISCANGTDALTLALMAWKVGEGDAIFVPDFTFFASAETVAYEGAMPIFVDVEEDTFNMSPASLEEAIQTIIKEGKLKPRAIVVVDLFGQPADFVQIRKIAERYNLLILEDAAQGFGGRIGNQIACSFGDIATTSFFPAKPLGCYGDGGAIFTNNDEWADLIRSYRIHGKGEDKYDNVRIGMNSRLDTIQAAILQVKLKAFKEYELDAVNRVAERYTAALKDLVRTPLVKDGFYSSWAQYTIVLQSEEQRNSLQAFLKEKGIPSMIYYPKAMHEQRAFSDKLCEVVDLSVTTKLCKSVLALPMHPYLEKEEQDMVIKAVKEYL